MAEDATKEAKTEDDKAKKAGAPEAAKVSATASKDKAAKLKSFAKEKVEKILEQHKTLEKHIKKHFDELEAKLLKTGIKATFDPKDKK